MIKALRTFKPTTPSRRGTTGQDFSDLTKSKAEKSLTRGRTARAGRNNQGRISVRFRGGGAKRRLRKLFDFKGLASEVSLQFTVLAIEYDPNRTSRIALLAQESGQKAYVIAPKGLKVGQTVRFSRTENQASSGLGDRRPLKAIPDGALVHNVELKPGEGGRLARSAGGSATVVSKEAGQVTLKLPSGEIRKVSGEALASVGQVGNIHHGRVKIGKAGRNRHLGRRPRVRGSAMFPAAHPHGGGEGKAPIGLKRGPRTAFGKPARGVKTRSVKKYSDRLIVSHRRSGRR